MADPADLAALAVTSTPRGPLVALVGPHSAEVGDWAAVLEALRAPAYAARRLVVWSCRAALPALLDEHHRPPRLWDVAEAHRMLHGGWTADPGTAWAGARGLRLSDVPAPPTGDLFEFASSGELDSPALVRADGHLRPDAVHGPWIDRPDRLLAWARAALDTAVAQQQQALTRGSRVAATIVSESAAAALCVELERTGLPVDRPVMESLVLAAAGPRPTNDAEEAAARRARDAAVLDLVPGRESTDLRNPAQVKELLAAVGVSVPNTRKWVLEPYRDTSPLVEALLTWRKAERIATTYGYRWLDTHVGPDDRLRGRWTACDGAAGRMTAENGLHNLPVPLRPGVAAHPGHVFVRADLGQIEPRVLAVVATDPALAAATASDDLYQPVAERLGVERAVAKVAILAAMYGQRSGTAGEALAGLERAYPVAMGVLDAAYDAGTRGQAVVTHGGRIIATGPTIGGLPPGRDPAVDAARGRFARNAIIQGSAAELFKAWAATVRAGVAPLGAEIVLCLHDELIVHTPQEHAGPVAALVESSLADAARRWSAGAPVRFVADTSIIGRWSQAKG